MSVVDQRATIAAAAQSRDGVESQPRLRRVDAVTTRALIQEERSHPTFEELDIDRLAGLAVERRTGENESDDDNESPWHQSHGRDCIDENGDVSRANTSGSQSDQCRWVRLDGGRCVIGAQCDDSQARSYDAAATVREGAPFDVALAGFEILDFPVSVADYEVFLDGGGYDDESYWSTGGFGDVDEPLDWDVQRAHPGRPVVGVNWFEAAAFGAWSGAALPTEVQWERAARGLTGRRFPWGDEDPTVDRVNAFESAIGHPTERDAHVQGATPSGVLDLAGNVWEWCRDVYRSYDEELHRRDGDGEVVVDGETNGGVDAETRRVFRGGCFDGKAVYARAAMRAYGEPDQRFARRGFRLVRPCGGE